MKKILFISLAVLVVITIALGYYVFSGSTKTSKKYNVQTEEFTQEEQQESFGETEEVSFVENNQKNTKPNIPCLCNEPNLIFDHSISDVSLSKNEKFSIERPHGYAIRWCAYGGKADKDKVKQLTQNGQTTMTLQALEDNVTVKIRYYIEK